MYVKTPGYFLGPIKEGYYKHSFICQFCGAALDRLRQYSNSKKGCVSLIPRCTCEGYKKKNDPNFRIYRYQYAYGDKKFYHFYYPGSKLYFKVPGIKIFEEGIYSKPMPMVYYDKNLLDYVYKYRFEIDYKGSKIVISSKDAYPFSFR